MLDRFTLGINLDSREQARPVEIPIRYQVQLTKRVERVSERLGNMTVAEVFANHRAILALHQPIVPEGTLRAHRCGARDMICSTIAFATSSPPDH